MAEMSTRNHLDIKYRYILDYSQRVSQPEEDRLAHRNHEYSLA